MLADHLAARTTAEWLAILEPADVWCADVLTWPRLLESDGFRALEMIQTVTRENGASLRTTRCPIRIDGGLLASAKASPRPGEHTEAIAREFELDQEITR